MNVTTFILKNDNMLTMTSGTSRKLKVRCQEEFVSEALRRLWAGLPYPEKKIKYDRLPKDFWGSFKVKGPDSLIKKYNKVNFFAEMRKKDDEYIIIKVEAVIPAPIFGHGALKIVARCIFLLAKYFQRRNIDVESLPYLLGPTLKIK